MLVVCSAFDAEAHCGLEQQQQNKMWKNFALVTNNSILQGCVADWSLHFRTREIILKLLLLQQPSGINYKKHTDV